MSAPKYKKMKEEETKKAIKSRIITMQISQEEFLNTLEMAEVRATTVRKLLQIDQIMTSKTNREHKVNILPILNETEEEVENEIDEVRQANSLFQTENELFEIIESSYLHNMVTFLGFHVRETNADICRFCGSLSHRNCPIRIYHGIENFLNHRN